MKKIYNSVLLVVLLVATTNAQWTSYTTSNGLVHNEVYGIHVGIDALKWFGTVGGLSRLSQTNSWTSFTISNSALPVNYVYPVMRDTQGNLWVGTRGGGVVRLTGASFTIFGTNQGIPSNIVRSLFEDNNGNIWVGTGDGGSPGQGVAKFNGVSWTKYSTVNGLAGNTVRGIIQDSQNNMWFATSTGLSKFNGTTWTNYTTNNGLTHNNLTGIAIDLIGRIWVCTWGGGICILDPYSNTWSYFTEQNSDISSNNIHCIAVDRFRNIWIGTYDYGLNFYSFGETSWTLYTTAHGLPHNKVNVIFIDPFDGVWVGTNGGVATNNPTVNLIKNKPDELKIYPNPVNDYLYLNNVLNKSTITIYDMNGKIVYSYKFEKNNIKIDMTSFEQGTYFVSISNEKSTIVRKVLKVK